MPVFDADGVRTAIGTRGISDQTVMAKGVGKSLHVYTAAAL